MSLSIRPLADSDLESAAVILASAFQRTGHWVSELRFYRSLQPDGYFVAEQHGADSITLHLREDRRHIQDADVERLLAAVRTKVNLEMAVTAEMVAIACRLRPADVGTMREMRKRLEDTAEKGNLKRGPGGLVDIEFLVQMLQLRHGRANAAVRVPGTLDALSALSLAGKLDIDDNPQVATQYEIRGIPTLLMFRSGQVVGQVVGAVPRSRIEDMIKKAL